MSEEEAIHVGVVDLLRYAAKPGVIYYHPPNGEHRNPITGAKLKRMGVRPGVPDLAFVLPGGKAAFMEIKAKRGRQSDTQREFEALASVSGAPYVVVRSIDQAREVLQEWGAIR